MKILSISIFILINSEFKHKENKRKVMIMTPNQVKNQIDRLSDTKGFNSVDFADDKFQDRALLDNSEYPHFFIWKHLTPELATKTVKILKIVPKETETLYCQGLKYQNKMLQEAAGKQGESRLVAYSVDFDKPDSKLIKQDEQYLSPRYFAEGIAFDTSNVQMLTYKENQLLTFDIKQNGKKLIQTDKFIMQEDTNGIKEGWGLELIPSNSFIKKEVPNQVESHVFVASDGSDKLFYYSYPDFKLLTTKIVLDSQGMKVLGINEMELVGDLLQFNLQQTDAIAVYDIAKDKFMQQIDASELLSYEKTANSNIQTGGDVLNGIAFDGKHFILTGKQWKNYQYVDFE